MFSSVEVGMKYIMYPYGDNGLIVRGINSIRYGHKMHNVTLSPYVLLVLGRGRGYEMHNVEAYILLCTCTYMTERERQYQYGHKVKSVTLYLYVLFGRGGYKIHNVSF